MKEAVILGGGLTGLVVADRLQDNGYKVIVIEKEKEVGGMCKTKIISDGKYTVIYDLGPHKFATKEKIANDYFDKYVKNPSIIPITGEMYLKGKKLRYPPSIVQILSKFPLDGIFCGISYLMKGFYNDNIEKTYASYLRNKMGFYTYNFVFKDYANKIWGDPNNLDQKLAETRTTTPSILQLVKNIFTGKNDITFNDFKYPFMGIGFLINQIERKIKENGGIIITDCVPIKYSDGLLTVTKEDKNMVFKDAIIISTIKPFDMGQVLGFDKSFAHELKYRTNNLIYFLIKNPKDKLNTWLFYPDSNVVFNRTSINFTEIMAGIGYKYICAEITSDRAFDMEEFNYVIVEQIKDFYNLDNEDILAFWTDNIKDAYPIYHKGFESVLDNILNKIEEKENIYCIGRSACHNYNNMDHTIVEALDLADNISMNISNKGWSKIRKTYNWRIVD